MLKRLARALASAHAAGDLPIVLERGGQEGGAAGGEQWPQPRLPRAYVMPGPSQPVRPGPRTPRARPAGGQGTLGPWRAPPCPVEGDARCICHRPCPTSRLSMSRLV